MARVVGIKKAVVVRVNQPCGGRRAVGVAL